MRPTPVQGKSSSMLSDSRKRPSTCSEDDDHLPPKRQRTTWSHTLSPPSHVRRDVLEHASMLETTHELARKGLRRSIALVLDKVGFDVAKNDAMESFVSFVEAYMHSLAHDVTILSYAARRTQAIPPDFDISLKRFNLTTGALKPHLNPPVSRSRRIPCYEFLPDDIYSAGSDDFALPILDEALDGANEKANKAFVPSCFPSFPSLHTFKYTPEYIANVTIHNPNDLGNLGTVGGASIGSQTTLAGSVGGSSQTTMQATFSQALLRPLAPGEIPRGDAKKMREAAVKEAKYGEEALRGLMRASKIARQKDVWATAQREPARKQRYKLWEEAMRELIEEGASGGGAKGGNRSGMGQDAVNEQEEQRGLRARRAKECFEIADHSMIVNTERAFYRNEAHRSGKRKPVGMKSSVVERR